MRKQEHFLALWARGTPIIAEGVGSRFHQKWTPDHFSSLHGDLPVPLVEVRSGRVFHRPLRTFLQGFSEPDLRPQPNPSDLKRPYARKMGVVGTIAADSPAMPLCHTNPSDVLLKLKDWPAASDFADLLPAHFADLMQALPLSPYTKRDGALNLAATLPRYFLPPDLGPKMYLGYGALTAEGRFTRMSMSERHAAGTVLHVDMADAVNILCHVEPIGAIHRGGGQRDEQVTMNQDAGSDKGANVTSTSPCSMQADNIEDEDELAWMLAEGEAAGAVWDIWHADDTEKICAFLRRVASDMGQESPSHPIHDQTFYINAQLRKRLREEEGVVGWRFVQRLGDAVFIPCGCPHQVLNLRSCIKVAMDFVSPEHVPRCLANTEQFRLLPHGHRRQQDSLSTKSTSLQCDV